MGFLKKSFCNIHDNKKIAESHKFLYQGGLKIWECSYDLGQYLFENNIEFQDKLVLDLGCGTGIIGLVALRKNSIVHFQDYVRI